MNKVQKLQGYIKAAYSYLLRLRDVRVAGQAIFIVIVLLVSWSGVKSIDTNYALQKQIAQLQQQNTVEQLQNNNQKLQNDYYNSDQYLELSARQNFGLAAPGETELIVPKDIALSYTTPLPTPATTKDINNDAPFYERNIQAWVDFFLHRQPATD